MGKRLKISGIISLILGFISFSWLIYNYIAFEYIRPKVVGFEELGRIAEGLGLYVWIGLLVSFLFHLSAILTIIYQFQFFKKANILRIATLLVGVISSICLVGDWTALNDIGRQYQIGVSTQGEWTILYLTFIPHGLFHLLMFILLFFTFRDLRNQPQPELVLKDEIIFNAVHYVGVLCGAIGLGFTFLTLLFQVPSNILRYLIPFYCTFIILPYCLIAFYWLFMKRKEKLSEWYDEKQLQDISKAGIITLLLSIPCMAIMFLFNYLGMYDSASIMWFPYYMFLILLIFSGTSLYYYKKR